MDILSKIVEWVKLKPLYVVAAGLTSGALLFLPKPWLTSIGLKGFVDAQKGWVRFAFLASCAILTAYFSFWLAERIKKWHEKKSNVKRLVEGLADLTGPEKGILKRYMDQDRKSITLQLQNGIVGALAKQGFIVRMQHGNAIAFAFLMQPCVWHHLKAHPELLDGAIETNDNIFA
ncbi:MAG: super-infection exclusion protein B [Fimbriimonadaceae bacterium]